MDRSDSSSLFVPSEVEDGPGGESRSNSPEDQLIRRMEGGEGEEHDEGEEHVEEEEEHEEGEEQDEGEDEHDEGEEYEEREKQDEGEEEEPVLPNGSSRGLSSDSIFC